MKTIGKKQKLMALSLAILLHLETVVPAVAATVIPANGATVQNGANNVPVVNIVAPNEKGLSHNKFTDFNVGQEGLVFNNATQNVDTRLAGNVAANSQLNGRNASIILAEVTSNRNTNLNGLMEVAGQKADLVIANPNGIVGNGFGFINVGRAVLTTGKPVITDGNLDHFEVQKGTVEIIGNGNKYYDNDGNPIYEPVDKLDIYAAAAKINAELWAKDSMHVVTGKNNVAYSNSGATRSFNASGTGVSLDVAALGGMYAGKIYLVGTNTGLGVNVAGAIHADNELHITNNGKITFQEGELVEEDPDEHEEGSGNEANYTGNIYSGGTMDIVATGADIQNNANVSAVGSIGITAGGKLTNNGKMNAGEQYETVEGSDVFEQKSSNLTIQANEIENGNGVLDASNRLSITTTEDAKIGGQVSAVNNVNISAKNINVTGTISSEQGELYLSGTKVKYNERNLSAKDKDSIHITETDPDQPVPPPEPEPPRKAEELTTPDLPNVPGTAETRAENKVEDSTLALVADASADGKYKPIIDKTASGIDLVQIAEANANGVSRNLYTDFNVKSTGLILNNASKYAKTELGGYVDKNMRIAGNGAKVILNEVTSSHATTLQGFLEVAGNKASVVIANANGISVNGAGFINADNVTIASAKPVQWENGNISFSENKADIRIAGDGVDGTKTNTLEFVGNNISNNASEIYGNNIAISADGTLSNTGKTGAKNDVTIKAANVENTEEGVIEAGRNFIANVTNKIHQNKASIKAGNKADITTGSLNQEGESLLSSGNELNLTVTGDVDNDKSTILSSGNLLIHANNLNNKNSALLQAGKDFTANTEALLNDHSNIYVEGNSTIQSGSFANTNNSAFHTGKDLTATVETFTNTHSAIDVQKNMTGTITHFLNEESGYFGVGGNTEITGETFTNQKLGTMFFTGTTTINETGDFFQEDGLMAGGSSISISAKNIVNQNDTRYKEGSLLSAAGNISLTATETLHNRSSTIQSDRDINIQAKDVVNEKEKFTTGWDVTYEYISYKIPHMTGPRYYDAMREFTRTIHTGVIKEETNDAKILASGNITINADRDVKNHYSQIAAGKNLTVNAGGKVENIGYQGTIHHDDLGRENHYWKYKKHTHWHLHCHWVYGTTVVPYQDGTNKYDQTSEGNPDSERLAVMGAVGTVKITATNTVNKTLEADGTQYADRQKTVSTAFTDKLKGNEAKNPLNANNQLLISQLQYNSRIYSMNRNPSAKYLIETDPRFANYKNFLSSDYLLERVKSDPEKVSKRLGDGYFEQQLVMQQILGLTGKTYLDNYGSDMEQFRALMESGATVAEELKLQVGVALTAEQVASLTSDIVWLVKEHINGEDVLVPEVYLASIRKEDLKPSGALITGGEVELYSKQNIQNIGTINGDKKVALYGENVENKGGDIRGGNVSVEAKENITNQSGTIFAKEDLSLKANNIINETTTKKTQYKELTQVDVGNTAIISAGKNLSIEAKENITDKGGQVTAGDGLTLSAGKNINIETVAKEKHVAVTYSNSSAEIHGVENKQSLLAGKNVSLKAGEDANLKGTLVSAEKDTEITATNNVNMTAVKDFYSEETEVGRRGSNFYNRKKQVDETVKGTTVAGKENTTVTAGENILVKGSNILTETGKISLNAGKNISIENETEHHETVYELHEKVSGVLSTKTKDIYDAKTTEKVIGSAISGKTVDINSENDTNVKASAIAGDGDVSIHTGGTFKTESADTVSESTYIKQVKKSGILSGGGLGFTIGKEKKKDQYTSKSTEQVGSVIGSVNGSVTIQSDKDASVKASTVTAKKDVGISGRNIEITAKDNTYYDEEKHEYKKSGITVSVASGAISTVGHIAGTLQKGMEVKDKRLAALYGYEAGTQIKNDLDGLKEALKGNIRVGVTVGVGSSSNKSESKSMQTEAVSSRVKAGENVNLESTKDITIQGSDVSGKNVNLKAGENLNISSAEQTSTNTTNQSSKGGSIGVTFGGGLPVTVTGNMYSGKNKENAETITHRGSKVIAEQQLSLESKKDTSLLGSQAKGNQVMVDVGGNLSVESQQERNNYDSYSKSKGFDFDTQIKTGETGGGASVSNIKINSDYKSVKEQAGIYAGKEGFSITVKKNTDLKGAVIDSKAEEEKNSLTTGTLSWEDQKNSASYKDSVGGFSIQGTIKGKKDTVESKDSNEKESAKKEKADKKLQGGFAPFKMQDVKGHAESTTKAGIAKGKITITDKGNQKQDVQFLNRDPKESLNKLAEIFDKNDVKERHELVNTLSRIMYKEIGDLAAKKGWKDGDLRKTELHALAGAISAALGGGNIISGAAGAGVMEHLQPVLSKSLHNDPYMKQVAAVLIGNAVGKLTGEGNIGKATAWIGTRFNDLEGHGDGRNPLDEDEITDLEPVIVTAKRFWEAAMSEAMDRRSGFHAGTALLTSWSLVSDTDIHQYGPRGAVARVIIDSAATVIVAGVTVDTGFVTGVVISAGADYATDLLKDYIAPALTPEERERQEKEYIESRKEIVD